IGLDHRALEIQYPHVSLVRAHDDVLERQIPASDARIVNPLDTVHEREPKPSGLPHRVGTVAPHQRSLRRCEVSERKAGDILLDQEGMLPRFEKVQRLRSDAEMLEVLENLELPSKRVRRVPSVRLLAEKGPRFLHDHFT